MFQLIVYSLQIFFVVLDCVILIFLLRSFIMMLPFAGSYIMKLDLILLLPMCYPIQYLLRHSVLHTVRVDLSPYILLLVLSYLQGICAILLNC